MNKTKPLIVGVMFMLFSAVITALAGGGRPNIIVIFTDDHGYADLSCMGIEPDVKKPIIWCPAWGLVGAGPASPILAALEENRMLVLEMRNRDGNLAAAKQRNEFVMNTADQLWLPHVTPGGMLDGLISEIKVQGKVIGNER